jgi:hypothetical protein
MSFLKFLIWPGQAFALEERFIVMTTGIRIPLTQVLGNVTAFLAVSSVGVCTLIFLTGAGQLTLSRGDQTKVDNGKKMMIGSLIGLGLILGAFAIVRTVLYFLYEGA